MVAMRNKVEIPDITFTSADFESMDPKQDDPMVITIKVVDCLFLDALFGALLNLSWLEQPIPRLSEAT
ncbi:hypothetical protein JHK86_055646 [Glycine max]|nr:hypothetical protein JHK86_055646 [Glycine max]